MLKSHSILLTSFLLVFMSACAPKDNTSIATETSISTIPLAQIATLTPSPTTEKTPGLTITPSTALELARTILFSPNGEFVAKQYDEYKHPSLDKQVIEILDKKGALLWQVPYQGEIGTADPHPSLNIYGWSKDSSYLYFYYHFSPDGGDFAFWWDGFNLQRIEVVGGDIERVIPGEDFIAFAFSPDETQLAYTRAEDNPSIIFIRDLTTGKEKTADVIFPSKNYIRVGGIVWSPSGKELVFHTENDEYIVQTIYLDVITMKQRMIREYRLWSMWFSGWSDDGKLQFSDFTEVFQLDVKTNETTIIGTPTPYY